MHIIFNIKALSNPGGGAERVLVNISAGLLSRGHKITVITSDPEHASFYYSIGEGIKIIKLGVGNVGEKTSLRDVISRILKFRFFVKKIRPDVVISFMHSGFLLTGIALLGTRIPMIASEHAPPEHYSKHIFQKILLQLTPFIADRITVVSEQIYNSYGWWLRRSMVIVPNPVIFSSQTKIQDAQLQKCNGKLKIILSVGRLGPEKNHSCLISAFSLVSPLYPNWCLRIVGDGVLRSQLEGQVRSLGLEDKVYFPGAISDVSIEYISSDIFVSPSLYESFGLATVEALLHGLPAVGFDDCQGTNRLIIHGENGMLVSGNNRIKSLAYTLNELMRNPQELNRLSNASSDKLKNMFNIDSVLNRWELLIEEVFKSSFPTKRATTDEL